jgi:hypothetical protein
LSLFDKLREVVADVIYCASVNNSAVLVVSSANKAHSLIRDFSNLISNNVANKSANESLPPLRVVCSETVAAAVKLLLLP